MAADGLDGIMGTRRVKAATWSEQGADEVLITTQQKNQEGLHCAFRRFQWRASDARSSSLLASAAASRAITTRSIEPMPPASCRKDSRARRLIRFRATACGDTRRETTRPRRAPVPALAAPETTKYRSRDTQCWLSTLSNCGRRNRRLDRGSPKRATRLRRSVRPGPWRGGRAGSRDRLRSSCGHENRGCACASARWVERYVSLFFHPKTLVLSMKTVPEGGGNILLSPRACQQNVYVYFCGEARTGDGRLWITSAAMV